MTPAFLVGGSARDPSLAADRHGRVALTWVTGDSSGQDLWLSLSADSGSTFAPPVRVNSRHGSVASDAESRPITALGPAGELLVAWSERREGWPSVADLVVRASADGGRTLGPPSVVNDDAADGRPSFHGSGALVALPNGDWFAVWVDTREHTSSPEGSERASLFSALSSDGGQSWSDNRSLTSRACACCRVAALADSDGTIAVAYRTAVEGVRDPALLVTRDRGVSVALDTVLAADGWRAGECPMDGPAGTADRGGGGRVAWYSGAANAVWNVPWRATGIAGLRREVSDSLASGRHPCLLRLGDATLVALETAPRSVPAPGAIALRSLEPDGTLTPWLYLGAGARGAAMTAIGDHAALVGWTERGDPRARVRLARVMRHPRGPRPGWPSGRVPPGRRAPRVLSRAARAPNGHRARSAAASPVAILPPGAGPRRTPPSPARTGRRSNRARWRAPDVPRESPRRAHPAPGDTGPCARPACRGTRWPGDRTAGIPRGRAGSAPPATARRPCGGWR